MGEGEKGTFKWLSRPVYPQDSSSFRGCSGWRWSYRQGPRECFFYRFLFSVAPRACSQDDRSPKHNKSRSYQTTQYGPLKGHSVVLELLLLSGIQCCQTQTRARLSLHLLCCLPLVLLLKPLARNGRLQEHKSKQFTFIAPAEYWRKARSVCIVCVVCVRVCVVCVVRVRVWQGQNMVSFIGATWSTMDQRTSENDHFFRRIIFYIFPGICERFRPNVLSQTPKSVFFDPRSYSKGPNHVLEKVPTSETHSIYDFPYKISIQNAQVFDYV